VETSLNGDLGVRVDLDTTQLDWQPSPSGTVQRKRLHRVGPAESGQVTSVVRYEPGASFHEHPHPEGEEILVLDGVFSDEHGDWKKGTYLLNPEGFSHAPFSRDGCLLFVKLRQYPGRDRVHVALDTDALRWKSTGQPGLRTKTLYRDAAFHDEMRLEHWSTAEAALSEFHYEEGAEIFVLAGHFDDEVGHHARGSWLRLPAGTRHPVRAAMDALVYVKVGGFHYLRSGDGLPPER
jgi:anti-sigma factor ChrR (cupin superfamily)